MSCDSNFYYLTNEYEFLSDDGFATSLGQDDSSSACRFFNPMDTTATTHRLDYDLGAGYAGIAPADCVVIFNFINFILYGGTVSVSIKAADDAAFSVNLVTASLGTVVEGDLVGITGKDWYQEFDDFSSSKRYWRIEITTTNSVNYPVRDVFIGSLIKPSRAPSMPLRMALDSSYIEAKRSHFTFDLNYEHLSIEDKNTLSEKLYAYHDIARVAVIDKNNKFFFGKKLLRAMITNNLSRLKKAGLAYKAEIKFRELL